MNLSRTLKTIQSLDYRKLDSHPKRSSVAIILHVPGHYDFKDVHSYIAALDGKAQAQLLFIKRAVSQRDRWSGHIALPGGKHEPGESDVETAQREALEEVGVDLARDGFLVGGLDQRLLKVSWGRRIAMILCPYVFVINKPVLLKPQWTEVASAFWHSFDEMLRPDRSSCYYVPIGDRVNLGWLGPLKPLVSWNLGAMQFPAVELVPETQVSAEDMGFTFKCWGVTLGVLSDIFEVHNPGHIDTWWLPTISAWDMRFWVWVFNSMRTRSKRLSLAAEVQGGPRGGNLDLMNKLIEGHFKRFPLAIGTAVVLRYVGVVWLVWWWRRARARA